MKLTWVEYKETIGVDAGKTILRATVVRTKEQIARGADERGYEVACAAEKPTTKERAVCRSVLRKDLHALKWAGAR